MNKAKAIFNKYAGALDPIRDKMEPSIWSEDKHLRPKVRKTIMDNILSYIPKEAIKQVVVLGAITGLQYIGDDADVDVNVVLEPPELVDQLWEIRRAHNDKLIPGTKHALNIYLQPHTGEIPGYQDSYFGVYDVLTNSWLVEPPDKSTYRDPQTTYWSELVSIKMIAKEFIRRANRYINATRKLSLINLKMEPGYEKNQRTLRLEQLIQKETTDLVNTLEDLEMGRAFAYGEGWGIPRIGYYNLLYKYLHGHLPEKYSAIFKEIEEIKINQKKLNVSTSGSNREQNRRRFA